MKTAKLSFDHVIAGRTFTFDASVLPGSPGGNLDPPEPGEVNYLDVHEGDTPIGWDAFEAMLPSLVGTDVSPMYCVEGGVVFQRPVVRANLCTLKHQHGDGASCRPPFRVVNIVKVDGEDGPDAVGCGFVCEGAMREPKNLQLVIDAVKRMGFGAVAVTTVPPNSTLARDVQTTEEAPPGYPNSDIIF